MKGLFARKTISAPNRFPPYLYLRQMKKRIWTNDSKIIDNVIISRQLADFIIEVDIQLGKLPRTETHNATF
jgi:hypothetical protein